ncbi:MAG: hypothetical protein CME71_03435 [Halobacteriovorax sp.]|nr:hypothetical protein [Halobacteriovorax sp.]
MSQWWEIDHSTDPIKTLEKLVSISSKSDDTKGVARVQSLLKKLFEREGLVCYTLSDEQSKAGPLLIAELPGQTNEWVNLICHADTVHNKSDFSLKMKKLSDTKYTGPGVIDNKGGIVVILETIKKIKKLLPEKSHRTLGIRVVCSPNEEIGSPGFHHYFNSFSKNAHAVLGFEPAAPDGSIIGSRQGNRWYNIEVSGESAHAGRDHHLGVNAGHEVALKAVALEELTDYERGLTVNIGHLQAGDKVHNVVADHATALVDVRFKSLEQRKNIHTKIEAILNKSSVSNAKGSKSESNWKIVDDCPPFALGERSKKLFNVYQQAISKIEKRKIKLIHAGGCADSNHFNRADLPILDGLGPVGAEMHTNKEWIDVSSIDSRAQAAAFLINDLMTNSEITMNKPNLQIKRAAFSDMPAIAKIIRSSADWYSPFVSKEDMKEHLVDEKWQKVNFPRRDFWIGKIDEKQTVGTVSLQYFERSAYLGYVYLDTAHTGKGYGKKLLDHAKEIATQNGMRHMVLLAHPKAHWAISAYKKYGFTCIEKDKDKILSWNNSSLKPYYEDGFHLYQFNLE